MLINLFDVAVCWLVVANYIISYLGWGRVGGNGSDFFDCFAG